MSENVNKKERIITMFDRLFITVFIMATIRAANPITEVNQEITKVIIIITMIAYVIIIPNTKNNDDDAQGE